MSGPTRRLFIGLLPDDGVRNALTVHQQLWFWAGHRPMAKSQLHLTLHFLGEIDATREWALREALAGETVAPVELLLRTPECWSGGITVLRPDEHAALGDLQSRLASRLLQAGIAPHRDAFNPHVTLARDAPGAAPPEASRPIVWTVRDFALVWSRHAPARHQVLDRYGAG